MRYTIHFLALIFTLSFSSCNIGSNILKGFKKDRKELEAAVSLMAKTAAHDALVELTQDSNFMLLRSQLNTLLDTLLLNAKGDVSDMLGEMPDELLGDQTDSLIKARMKTISQQLYFTIDSLKGSLTDDQLSNYLTKLLKVQLQNDLRSLIDFLRSEIASDRTAEAIAMLRRNMQGQVDSLFALAMIQVADQADSVLFPRIHALLDRTEKLTENIKGDTMNILDYLIWGAAGLLVLGTILYFWRQSVKRKKEADMNEQEYLRHKEMVSILTRNIDKIESQQEYDKLTKKIKREMTVTGLEPKLKKILEEEKLLKQPEWEQKDHAVLQLLLTEIQSADAGERERLMGRARELGLHEHLMSRLGKEE